jgi:hypothetical protein
MARVAARKTLGHRRGVWLDRQRTSARATALIWLSVEDEDCVANIRQREAGRNEDDRLLIALLDWAGCYRKREDPVGLRRISGCSRISRARAFS